MEIIKNIIFKLINIIPRKLNILFIKLLLWSKSENLKPKESLRYLFEIDKILYGLEGRNATRYGNGVHVKHRLINYHQFFIDNIEKGDNILDFGCGNGTLAWDIAEHREEVKIFAIDIEKKNIEIAKKRFKHNNIIYILGDGREKLPDDKINVIIMSNVLEHIDNRIETLKVLKNKYPNAKMLVRVPMFDRDWRVPLKKELSVDYRLDETHFIEYTYENFKKEINQAGLSIKNFKINWGEIWAIILNNT